MKKRMLLVVIFLIIFGCVVSIWPLGIVKKSSESKSKAALYYDSGFIKDDIIYKQSFQPKESYVSSISIQMNRDSTFQKGDEGSVIFTVLDETGNIKFQKTEFVYNIKSKDYYEFNTNIAVIKDALYYYTIEVIGCDSEGPTIRFGEKKEIGLEENKILFYAGDKFPQYSTVATYKYKGDLSVWDVLTYYSFFAFVGAIFIFDIQKMKTWL